MDALCVAHVDDFLLGKTGVVLDLVDGRGDGGHGEELLQVLFAVLQGQLAFQKNRERRRGSIRC